METTGTKEVECQHEAGENYKTGSFIIVDYSPLNHIKKGENGRSCSTHDTRAA